MRQSTARNTAIIVLSGYAVLALVTPVAVLGLRASRVGRESERSAR